MENLDLVDERLKTMTYEEWERLFEIIPLIESCEEFAMGGGLIEDEDDPESYIIVPSENSKIVYDFERLMSDLRLIISFNWSHWDAGSEIARSGKYENLDAVTLIKLLIAFIRSNRFCDGALAARFEDGSILKILKELKKIVELK